MMQGANKPEDELAKTPEWLTSRNEDAVLIADWARITPQPPSPPITCSCAAFIADALPPPPQAGA